MRRSIKFVLQCIRSKKNTYNKRKRNNIMNNIEFYTWSIYVFTAIIFPSSSSTVPLFFLAYIHKFFLLNYVIIKNQQMFIGK